MLPYHEDGQRLEQLLQSLFDGEFTLEEGINILRLPILPQIFSSCCTLSYGSYDG
jgi:hypothetical protein